MADDLAAISADQVPRVGHYELLRTIGQGSFGKVWLGRHLPTGTEVAVKAIPRQGSSGLQSRLLQEARCMAALRHPNIVQLFEVLHTHSFVYLVMELVSGGDLWDHLGAHGALTETEARHIFRQLLRAVHYCHQKGIVHRDLKPTNVLLDADGNVKLADFGLSADFTRTTLRVFCGNSAYAAPELFLGGEYEGPPVDIWSLGVMLYKMVAGIIPFKGKDVRETAQKVLIGKYRVLTYFSPQLTLFLQRLLTLDPGARSSLEDFMKDPWLTRDQEEDLGPESEPPPSDDELDPRVMQEMVTMGIPREQIEQALTQKTYNNVMGTYLILKAKEPRVRIQTIKVRPFRSPDPSSGSPSPPEEVQAESSGLQQAETQFKDQEAGQKTPELAGPAASLEPAPATPGPGPAPAPATPGPSAVPMTATPGPRAVPMTTTPGPSAVPMTTTPGPSAVPVTATPGPRAVPVTATPGPRAVPVTATPGPRAVPVTATPGPSAVPVTATPGPRAVPVTATPGPRAVPVTATPGPRAVPVTATPGPRAVPVTATPGPRAVPVTATPGPSAVPVTATPGPSAVPVTATPGPSPKSPPTAPKPSQKSTTATHKFRPKWRKVTPLHSPKSKDPAPRPSPKTRTPTPSPSPKRRTATPRPRPKRRTATPPPVPDAELTTTSPPPDPESRNATHSPAPQAGPANSPCDHSTSSSRGTAEGASQGPRGLARRCLDFLKKLCLRPCKKGRGKRNRVTPL